jgi:hypothetical protein
VIRPIALSARIRIYELTVPVFDEEIQSQASTPQAPNIICGSFALNFNQLVSILTVPGPRNRKSISDEGFVDTFTRFGVDVIQLSPERIHRTWSTLCSDPIACQHPHRISRFFKALFTKFRGVSTVDANSAGSVRTQGDGPN